MIIVAVRAIGKAFTRMPASKVVDMDKVIKVTRANYGHCLHNEETWLAGKEHPKKDGILKYASKIHAKG